MAIGYMGGSNDWESRARQSSMTLPCWRLEGGPTIFSLATCVNASETRGKEGASGERLPISHVRVKCLRGVSVISKLFIESTGKLVIKAMSIELIH